MPQSPQIACVGVGSRDGERLSNMREALARLGRRGLPAAAVSWVYETEPVGLAADRPLLNGVAALEAPLPAGQLMAELLAVEAEMGRVRLGGCPDPGFRPIDLDLLLLGDEIHTGPGLLVPHPRLHERRFVLQPLVDVAPDAMHPLLRRSALDLLEACSDTAWVRRHAPPEAWLAAADGGTR